MESPLAVLSAAAHYVEQMEQLKLSSAIGASSVTPGPVPSPGSVGAHPGLPVPSHSHSGPPLTLLVPCANGLFMPYIQQPGFLYGLPGANLHAGQIPVPPNKLALAPLSPGSSNLSSPMSSLGSNSAVSTPTEEYPSGRQLLLSHLGSHSDVGHPQPELLHLHRPEIIRKNDQAVSSVPASREVAPQPPKVVLRKKQKTQNSEIQQSVENHFRRSLGSNYNEIKIQEQQRPKTNVRRRPHSVFVSEEVDRHFEKSLGFDAWQVIKAKRAKPSRKTWN